MTEPRGLPSAERLHQLIRAMAGQAVVMCVDPVADRFITGAPKRISREAPVLILRYEGETFVPGGGANALVNVAALGGRPLPLGVVGDDDNGARLRAALEERGIDTRGILTLGGYQTPTKTRILGGGRHAVKQQIVRFDVEDEAELGADELAAFEEALAAWRGEGSVAVLSDYGYGSVTPALAGMLRAALGPEAVLLCDSRYRLDAFAGIDGATPNEEEAEALAGGPFEDDEKFLAAGFALRRRLGVRFLLITRGAGGMSLFEEEGAAHLPTHGGDQVADVTGAGDTVIGTFALALAAGASPLEAALLADYAGGIVVHKLGTATASPDELLHAVDADPRPREEIRWDGS